MTVLFFMVQAGVAALLAIAWRDRPTSRGVMTLIALASLLLASLAMSDTIPAVPINIKVTTT